MERNGVHPVDRRRLLFILAVVLTTAGLLLALSAPGGPLSSNKAHAYGTDAPPAPKPTNPKTRAECVKYYGDSKPPLADARECFALAARNAGNKKCAKKKGAA